MTTPTFRRHFCSRRLARLPVSLAPGPAFGTLARPRLAGLALVGLLAAAGALLIATLQGQEPLPATLDVAGSTEASPRFVDRNGIPLNVNYTGGWNIHDRLHLPEIPPFLREAFIHAEDKRFRSHGGPDWLARLAALATNVQNGESIRGASTISEQVVRMLHPRPRTVWTRWLEGFEAARLERRFSKDEILAFYLNQVPYADNRRGVRQAAELYFARDLATLSDREMLALAVLVRSPSRLDLHRDAGASHAAIGRLADLMLGRGAIDAARHRAILAESVEIRESSLAVSTPHFLQFARERAAATPAGGRVVTTLDAALQSRLQDLLDTRVAGLAEMAVGEGAVLVADHATGEVLAWVVAGGGEAGGPKSWIDPVTTLRQPGSAQKPLLYALALERGASLADVVVDAPLAEDVGDGLHRYRNYSERYYGPVTLREALANSLNIPALKVVHAVGAGEYLEFLESLGITSLAAHPDHYGDGLALGNGEVSLFELVQAYAALANRGRALPLTVLRDPVALPRPATVVSPETASLIADVLSDPEARAAEFGQDSVLNLPVQTAVKTGTSSDYRDAWAVGFDSRFTVGVWMGNVARTPTGGVTGSIGPALLLRSVFAELNRDGRTAPLYLSPRLTRRELCLPSPRVAPGSCLERGEWFDPRHVPAANRDAGLAAASPSAEGPAARPSNTGAAPTPSIRFRQPTDGLELAFDPRLPAESQAFRFLLDGVDAGDSVAWTIDGDTESRAGPGLVWPVTRGSHRVAAVITRDGELIAHLDAVTFTVR
jgi:penicillin-binding protein 1C